MCITCFEQRVFKFQNPPIQKSTYLPPWFSTLTPTGIDPINAYSNMGDFNKIVWNYGSHKQYILTILESTLINPLAFYSWEVVMTSIDNLVLQWSRLNHGEQTYPKNLIKNILLRGTAYSNLNPKALANLFFGRNFFKRSKKDSTS